MRTSVALLLALPLLNASALAAQQYPDIQAQWRNPTANQGGNPWDPTKKMGLAQEAPLTPEYQAIFEASIKAQEAGTQGNSPGSTCRLAGMPKMMNFSEAMEIVIRPAITYFIPMQAPVCRIYTDGRDWPDEPASFGGSSLGRWIDEHGRGRYDVLEVETRNLKGPRVFESTGLPLARDNQTVVKERIYLDHADRNALHDEVTTIDHALTRPWSVDKTFKRNPNPRPSWARTACTEHNNQIMIAHEHYYLSADGLLMPVRKNQSPPDLRYFRPRPK